MNWSYLGGCIGDLYNDEEFLPVRIKLPDGRIVWGVAFDGGEIIASDTEPLEDSHE